MGLAGAGATIWIASDHGFGPIHKYCSFNLWLLQHGFLRLKRGPVSTLKSWLFKAGLTPDLAFKVSRHQLFRQVRPGRGITTQTRPSRLLTKAFLSFNDVDWANTVAYSKGNYGQIFINLKGREPEGIVEPGAEYLRTRDHLINQLRQVVAPDTSEPLIGMIATKEEIYNGPHFDDAPDICFLPRDMRYLTLGNMDFNSNEFIVDAFGNSGGHRMNGVFMACGPNLKSGREVEQISICDVAPSLLYRLGMGIPDDFDGRVATGIFSDDYLKKNEVRMVPAALKERTPDPVFTPEEENELEERLRDLGYLG
jgi:predicted AlkP superfamily phosphohydrolase/phosphomutase